jgi:dienelactone hydrolase
MDVFRFYTDTHFEPDYENPLKTVIDFLAERPEVDMERLAILGMSFGRYFATRATAYEPRIKAFVANSPILKWEKGVKNESWHDSAKR